MVRTHWIFKMIDGVEYLVVSAESAQTDILSTFPSVLNKLWTSLNGITINQITRIGFSSSTGLRSSCMHLR